MEDDPEYQIDIHRRVDLETPSDARIGEVVRKTLGSHSSERASVSLAIVSDDEIARLNESYLQHSGPTDVLSFDLGSDLSQGYVEGEVVLSAETASREAGLRGGQIEGELLLYLVHGMLHLLGFDDGSAEAAEEMHRKEDALLVSFGYGAVYRDGRR